MSHYLLNWLFPVLCSLPASGGTAHPSHDTFTVPIAAHATAAVRASFAEGYLLESEEGRFTMRFPSGFSTPEASTVPLETAVGNLDMKVFTSAKGANMVLMAAYIDYPEEAFANGTEVMLDGAREGALKNLNGKLESQKEAKLMGHPGRSMTFNCMLGTTKAYGRADYFIVKPRLYQILLLTPKKGDLTSKPIKNSFASFTLSNTGGASAPRR